MDGGLTDRVALVTGASRAVGKGIALELGAAGATVFVTGRTAAPGQAELPGSVAETVAEVHALGGRGVGVVCDHRDDAAVADALARVRSEAGRLDVLVNNVFSSDSMGPWLGRVFWELPIEAWDTTIDIGLRSHYVASTFAVPLMLETGGGLIVNVSSSGAVHYAHHVAYGVGKAALDRMTVDMAHDLAPHGVAVISIWPGMVRTELAESHARRTDDGRTVIGRPGSEFDLAEADSPRYVGRGVVALATDGDVMARSGHAYPTAQLAMDYGFADIDGRVKTTSLGSGEYRQASAPPPE